MGSPAPAFVWAVTVLGTNSRGWNDTGPGFYLALEPHTPQHPQPKTSQAFIWETHDVAGLKHTASRFLAKNLSKMQGFQTVFVSAANAECLGLLSYQLRLAHM